MSYRFVIGDHSQVPEFLPSLQDMKIKIFEVSGGNLKDLGDHSRFSIMHDDEHDLAILFLGGNDIYDCCSPRNETTEILRIIEHLQQLNKKCGCNVGITVLVTDLELVQQPTIRSPR